MQPERLLAESDKALRRGSRNGTAELEVEFAQRANPKSTSARRGLKRQKINRHEQCSKDT